MDVPGVLAQVAGIDLPYPAAELLQSFIENALNLPSQPSMYPTASEVRRSY